MPPALQLAFLKEAAGASADTLACTRPDGGVERIPLPRSGVLAALAVQFVVEVTLRCPDGFFARLLAGAHLSEIDPATRRAPAPVRQFAAVAACLRAEQWSGPDLHFSATLAKTCRRFRVEPPRVDHAALTDLRAGLRAFGAAWRPLAPGAKLERTFPA